MECVAGREGAAGDAFILVQLGVGGGADVAVCADECGAGNLDDIRDSESISGDAGAVNGVGVAIQEGEEGAFHGITGAIHDGDNAVCVVVIAEEIYCDEELSANQHGFGAIHAVVCHHRNSDKDIFEEDRGGSRQLRSQ